MEPYELRIGHNVFHKKRWCTVLGIYLDDNTLKVQLSNKKTVPFSEIMPIPVTEDSIEKANFTSDELVFIKIFTCKYIHQLQNILIDEI